MNKNQRGFTMIELVIVIVILGILAATALPRFVDTSGEARQAAADGVAGALSSSSAINYSGSLAKGQINGATLSSATATTGITDTTNGCTNAVAQALLQEGGVTIAAAGDYTVGFATIGGTTETAPTTVGESTTCTLTSVADSNTTANFSVIGTK
jgi:MSHA pilin protein MshA